MTDDWLCNTEDGACRFRGKLAELEAEVRRLREELATSRANTQFYMGNNGACLIENDALREKLARVEALPATIRNQRVSDDKYYQGLHEAADLLEDAIKDD